MKTVTVFCACMLLCSNAVMASITGTDDFNDGLTDPVWDSQIYIGNAGLSETNGHMHFYTEDDPGTNAYRALLPWKVIGPFNENWEVQVSAIIPAFETGASQEFACGIIITPNQASEVVSNRLFNELFCRTVSAESGLY